MPRNPFDVADNQAIARLRLGPKLPAQRVPSLSLKTFGEQVRISRPPPHRLLRNRHHLVAQGIIQVSVGVDLTPYAFAISCAVASEKSSSVAYISKLTFASRTYHRISYWLHHASDNASRFVRTLYQFFPEALGRVSPYPSTHQSVLLNLRWFCRRLIASATH